MGTGLSATVRSERRVPVTMMTSPSSASGSAAAVLGAAGAAEGVFGAAGAPCTVWA
jgi:hypothetical protein